MRRTCLLLASGLLLAGCPGPTDEDDTGTDDTGFTGEGHHWAVLTTTDFAVGSLATVSLDTWAVSDELVPTSGDPWVVAEGPYVVLINRFLNDFVRVYDPGEWGVPVSEFSVGAGSNPQDVALVGGELYVSLYDVAELRRYDLESGALLGSLDLSDRADVDGLPEAALFEQVQGRLFLALQQLDRGAAWAPAGGEVVRISATGDTIDASWPVGPNPEIHPHPLEPSQLVVVTGTYTFDASAPTPALDGGIALLDPATAEVGAAVLTEAELGGHIVGYGETPSGHALLLTDDGGGTYSIHCYDWDRDVAVLAEQTADWLSGLAVNDRGEAWIAARSWTDSSGVLVYDIDTCASRTGGDRILTSLDPFDIAFY